MSIAATSLGVGIDTASPFTLNTGATVPPGALVVVKIGWVRTGGTFTPTCSGGSLTWDLDHVEQDFDSGSGFGWGVAIFSAPAPSGLASGTTITIAGTTFDFGVYIGAEYYQGVDLGSSRVDVFGGNSVFGSDTAWTTNAINTIADNVALSTVAWQDNATASTPGGSDSELWDSHDAALQWDLVSQWREVTSAGSYDGTGTWTGGAPDAYAAAIVAYKAAQTLRPDADIDATGWSTAPLFSKVDEDTPDGTVITATAS